MICAACVGSSTSSSDVVTYYHTNTRYLFIVVAPCRRQCKICYWLELVPHWWYVLHVSMASHHPETQPCTSIHHSNIRNYIQKMLLPAVKNVGSHKTGRNFREKVWYLHLASAVMIFTSSSLRYACMLFMTCRRSSTAVGESAGADSIWWYTSFTWSFNMNSVWCVRNNPTYQ